ncbi:CRAL-TRIO domain-containing protein [Thelonectria olida]|uniref:CRAL-TRIO domain-containing protein n=1 Tax=Thelonectria olida TaxID=1576542 RepID=A0A9P9AJR0_9HYPO|nr:CRAL-TRIO domain-containing protein [Thelonectria olida]
MAHQTEPGTLGNLTIEEEHRLQEAWVHLLRLCEVEIFHHDTPDKTKELRQHLSNKSPEIFRQRLWKFFTADHPDTMVLRFLRARKWDVEKAMAMLTSAIDWRDEQRIDEDIVRTGESIGLKKTLSEDQNGFMMQYRSGKSFVRGTDKENRPIYIIKVRLHDPNLQSPQSMEMFVLHNIESLRAMARAPNDKVCLIFDLSGFGLKNMDFHVVKFLVQVFEAKYPETLGVVLVHNAPFIFWGIWSVIKRWLNPVIASKIHFTNGTKELKRFISAENLQKCYGGQDNWEYKYIGPEPGENQPLLSEEKGAKIQNERNELVQQFEQMTIDWTCADEGSVEAKEKDKERSELVNELRDNYWKLDPFIRAKTYYHRVGVIGATGEVDFKAAR